MSNGLRSHIRTYWPVLLGYLSALLVAQLAERVGITLDGQTAFLVVGAVMTAIVYSVGRWLETRNQPLLRKLGLLLLSVGADLGEPTYPAPPPESAKHLLGQRRY